MDPLLLVGTWDFRREIRDHRDGAEYTAHGWARFTREDDGRVRWSEHGTLHRASGSTPVSRTLFLARQDDPAVSCGAAASDAVGPGASSSPAVWRVTFEDGRDFHPWTVGAVEHLCGRDLYEGGVEIPEIPAPSWKLRWRVTGPEKDYTMETRYTQAQ